MVEALLYLKENRHYWGLEAAKRALKKVEENLKSERVAKMLSEAESDADFSEMASTFEALNVRISE